MFVIFTVHNNSDNEEHCRNKINNRKTAATIDDINDNAKRGSVIKMTTMMNVTFLENNNNVNGDNNNNDTSPMTHQQQHCQHLLQISVPLSRNEW